jgi:Transposase DDE domain
MSIDDFIIEIYCRVSEGINKLFSVQKIRSRGFEPKLTDAEVLSIEIVGEYLGKSKDKDIWLYFHTHYKEWFPNLGTRTTFIRQSANLHEVKNMLHRYLIQEMKADQSELYVTDGFPIPVCLRSRAYYSKNFKGDAGYGYCASKELHYYGFKGLFLINRNGVIVDLAVVPANIDERDALMDMKLNITGILLGDKGFIRPELSTVLAEKGIHLITPFKKNMKNQAKCMFKKWMYGARRIVETVISQCTERFNLQKHGAKNIWHLKSRIYRKIVCHTLCIMINRTLGNNLDIAKLISY